MRYLKTLGLALIAALALSVVGASAASATAIQFHSGASSTILTGEQTGEGDVFTTNAGTVECTTATYTGSQSGATASEVTISPHYTNCTAFTFGGATITMNGCDYVFHSGTTENGKREGSVDIDCDGGVITVVGKLFGTTKCTVTIGSQTGLRQITYTNEGSGTTRDVEVEPNLTGIQYTQHAGTGFGACSSGSFSNGTYTGTATVEGENAEGGHVGIWVD